MTSWKLGCLSAYYWATLPGRWRAAARRTATSTEPVRISFYHRVADEHPNEWTMSTRAFARQVRWLHKRFDIVSLAEAQQRIAARCNRPTACITFDDGYAENMRFAVPLLLGQRIPFTYFVSTDHVLRGRPFPHDVAAGRTLPPNTPDDLRELAAAGVEIGGHTRGHLDVSKLPHDRLCDEIAGCKRELEQAIGTEVRYFAFPYGQHENLSSAAFAIAREAGYQGICSAYGGYNFPGDDPFHLRRFHADPEFIRFKNWLTVDPRKLRNHRDFEPGELRKSGRGGEWERSKSFGEATVQPHDLPLSPSPPLPL